MDKKNPAETKPYPAKKIKTFPKVSKTTIEEPNFNIYLKKTKPLRDYELAHIVQVILSMPLIWDSTNKYYKLNDNTTKLSDLLTELEAKLETADLNLDVDKDLQVDVKTLPTSVIAGMTSLPAGTNNIGDVDVLTLPTITQSTKHDAKTYKTAVFDASASGNLVAASTTGKVIKLHALTIQAQGTVVVNLNNGEAGASLMEWSFQAREGAVIPMANAPAYWAVTGVNTALYVTLSAAVTVTITAIYSDDDAA